MADKKAAEKFGRVAEALATAWLTMKGYRILARNFRTHYGEIDIIAKKGPVVAFVEVKARDGGDDLSFFRPRQRRRIERAALAFLGGQSVFSAHDIRFDLIVVSPWRWPRHLKDAWRTAE